MLDQGVAEMPLCQIRDDVESVADRRHSSVGLSPIYESHNPITFMEL
jgi:ribonucleotide reductase beta subunit family protein with ferritin-like domain